MKRIITGITAAGVAALMLFSTSARADGYGQARHDDGRYGAPAPVQPRYDGDGRRDDRDYRDSRGWELRRAAEIRRANEERELRQERRAFYAHWNGNPWRRAQFERQYARRCAELGIRG